MNEVTELDAAHRRMMSDEDDETARLRFYERVSDTEFLILLDKEFDGSSVSPQLFDHDGQQFALIFDREERLADFYETTAPYIAMSGRACVSMLDGNRIGLAVNLGVAPSSILIPADAVTWLSGMLTGDVVEKIDRPASFQRPRNAPPELITSLDAKLAQATGLAECAYLVSATYAGGSDRFLLGIVGAIEPSRDALTISVSEAVRFLGSDEIALDVAFFDGNDPLIKQLEKSGLRYDFPEPAVAPEPPSQPGMDPNRPPRLR